MVRLKLALIIGGGVLVFFGIQEWRLGSGCKAEAQKITCADLETRGPGDNAHVSLTDFFFSPKGYVYTFDKNKPGGSWKEVWIPAYRTGGDYHKACMEAAQSDKDLPAAPPVRILVKSSHVSNEAGLVALGEKETITGVLINKIESMGSEERDLLKGSYPGSNLESCYILEEGRTPSGTGALMGYFLGGLALMGVGGALFLVRR